ncbi:MAG: hypothetical protein AAF604_11630 [Acidobacteriota bacterium]
MSDVTPSASGARRRYLVVGVVVVAVALWLLLDAAGVGVPPLRQFWPVFAILGGLASAVDFFVGTRRPSSLGKAAAGIGTGALFFSLTYGYLSWRPLLDWLPGIPLIVGFALLTTWLAGGLRKPPLLVWGAVLAGLGLTAFASRYDWLERILPSPIVFWAVLLLALGLYMIWRAFRKDRGTA